MNRKRWAIITIILIVLIVVAGDFLLQRNLRGNAVEETETPEDDEMITLKWMVYGDKYKATDAVLETFNRELQEYLPGIRLELEIVSKSDYRNRWDMKMAAGEKMDLAWFGNDVLNYTEEVKQGSLMSLDYLLKSDGADVWDSVDQELWELEKRDGNLYGIPIYGPLYRANHTLVANKVVMDRFGDLDKIVAVNQGSRYTTKKCYAVMEDFLEQAKNHRSIGKGVSYQSLSALADKGYEGIYGSNSPFVVRIFDHRMKVYNKYELDSWRAYFQTMAEWYQKGYIREDVENLLNPSSEDGKLKGSVLYLEDYGEKETVPEVITPEYAAVRGNLDGYYYISYDGCRNSIVFPKTCSHPHQAMQLVNLLFSEQGKDLYRLLTNGIEKEHYIHTKGNVIARMSDNGNGYLYQLPPTAVGNLVQNYETAEGQLDLLIERNEAAATSPLEGFDLDVRMIAQDLERVDLVVNKYKDKLSQGTSEDWEGLYRKFCAEMRQAGSRKIIEEIQSQLEEFQKSRSGGD